jgi:single-strand DNA-binding protein
VDTNKQIYTQEVQTMSNKTTAAKANTQDSQAIFLAGNLGKNVATREFQSGKAVARTSLAVNQGRDQPPAWYNIEAWGTTGAFLATMCEKGQKISCKGFLKTESYVDKDGKPATKDIFNVIWVDLCVSAKA